ncbi:hypothetical protein JW710_03630 [Candidatus Dojkabacteria bacterium]|nr:hypothetical protein [Candidatus Dojkabacteria bacterium]
MTSSNIPQKVDPNSISEDQKKKDLEVLLSGKEQSDIRKKIQRDQAFGSDTPKPQKGLNEIKNPFRDE